VFYAGVERTIDETGDVFFMASPLKALSDYVYVHRKDWNGLKPIVNSLRIEPEEFENVNYDGLELLLGIYKSRRVQRFLKGLRKDLKL